MLAALRDELAALPGPPQMGVDGGSDIDAWAQPLVIDGPTGRLAFITAVTVFGAPHDVALAEIAIETLLPADAATAERLRALAATAADGVPA